MMTMLRAPRITRPLLEVLRTLLRFDFAREVRLCVEKSRSTVDGQLENVMDSTIRFFDVANKFNDADGPLLITATLMGMHGASEAFLPLTADRFARYEKLATDFKIGPEDFPGIPDAELRRITDPLERLQGHLKKVFNDATAVDQAALEKQFRKTSPGGFGGPSGSSGGFVN